MPNLFRNLCHSPLIHQWSKDRMAISQKRCMMQVSRFILVKFITKVMTAENIAVNRILIPHIKGNYQSERKIGFKRCLMTMNIPNSVMYSTTLISCRCRWMSFCNICNKNGMWKDGEDLDHQICSHIFTPRKI